MPFELPENLHPDCGPVAWLLGTWRGNGHGDYPTIDAFQFGQELIFTHDGRPFFHYMARAWIVDEDGERSATPPSRPASCAAAPRARSSSCSRHNTGFAEVWYGEAEGGKLEIVTDAVVRTETRQGVHRRQAALRQRRGRPALRLRHGGGGPGAPAAPLGPAAAGVTTAMSDDWRDEAPGERLPAHPPARADPRGRRAAGPRDPRRGARRGAERSRQRGERVDRLPHPRGARGAGAGPARAPQRPRPDVPLRGRARALPPGLPELSAGQSRLSQVCSQPLIDRLREDQGFVRRRGPPDRVRDLRRSAREDDQ